MTTPIVFFPSRGRLAQRIAGGLFLSALGGAVMWSYRNGDPKIGMIVGDWIAPLCILGGMIAAGFFVRALFKREVVLIIRDDGLVADRHWAGVLPWSEIRAVGVAPVRYGLDFLVLSVRHPERWRDQPPVIVDGATIAREPRGGRHVKGTGYDLGVRLHGLALPSQKILDLVVEVGQAAMTAAEAASVGDQAIAVDETHC